jgi:adenosylcobinamide-GDP ribazoletransferase
VHGRNPATAPVTRPPAGLRAAIGLFTVIPVAAGDLAAAGPRLVRWLPAVGALLALPAAAVLAATEAGHPDAVRRLLAAGLAMAVLAALTGGLHLDGLADSADGLGSRRPAAEALAIMRRPDAGPFGVAALLFVVGIQAVSLAELPPGWPASAGLITAVVTGRVGVLLATAPGYPPARPDGLGALVAGATSAAGRAAACGGLLLGAAVAGAAIWAGRPAFWHGHGAAAAALLGAARYAGAAAGGLLAGTVLCRIARRQLGGMTGDVHGALIELSTAAVLLVLALAT